MRLKTEENIGFDPLAVLTNQINQPLDGFRFGDIEFDRRFADVKIDLSGCATHVTEVRIGHFAGPVYDTAHDGNLHALEMLRAGLNSCGYGLQVEEGPPARRAGHEIGLETSAAGSLQNIILQQQALARAGFAAHQDRVADAVSQQGADDDCGAQEGNLRLQWHGFEREAVLEQDRIVAAEPLQFGRQ